MEYTKTGVYSFRIEPYNDNLALYYWQWGNGQMKAHIYRPLSTTSYYQIAKDFVATYPQYQIDFSLHNLPILPNQESLLLLQLNDRFYFDSTNYVNKLYFDLDLNYFGADITTNEIFYQLPLLKVDGECFVDLAPYGDYYYSPIRTYYFAVPNQGNTTFQLRIYNNVYVVMISFDGYYDSYCRYLVYEKYKIKTNCCLEALCNPNDYILI